MIYFFQKHFGDENVKTIRASIIWYGLIGLVVMFVMKTCVNNTEAVYDEFYRSWEVACTGMLLMLVGVIEFGVMLVIIIGKEEKVARSLPRMLPQCGVLAFIVLVNIFALGNPGRYRELNRDLMRVQENDPVVEDVTTFYIYGVLRDTGRRGRGPKCDYYLKFGEKRAGISEKMYDSIYKDINREFTGSMYKYHKQAPEGEYRITYLPNCMIILEVIDMEEREESRNRIFS